MGSSHWVKQFCFVLIAASDANNYEDAITEWVYRGERWDNPNNCICGHDIMDNRLVYNRLNGNTLVIGNCCISKFGVERQSYNVSRLAYLEFAMERATAPNQRVFVADLICKLDRYGKLRMTEKQKAWLESITGRSYRWNYSWD